jgi:hypothetical protein
MASRISMAVAALFFVGACQLPWSQSACDTTHIDWANFIQVGSAQYVAGPEAPAILEEGDLGPVYTTVKFRVSDNVCDPDYRPRDGDAAFLEPGTPVYQVKGQSSAERLAARFNGSILLYRAIGPTR